MKLPDFIENNVFESIREDMNIDKDYILELCYNYDFENKKIDNKYRRYSRDWISISEEYKKNKNYKCEECGLDCSITKYYLHVHHINNNRFNNSDRNLKALCRACLRK